MTLLETPAQVTADTGRRTLQFTVRGLPAPQGSKKYVGHSKAGRAILQESSEKVRPWRQDVVNAAEDAIAQIPGFKPLQGPVHLIVEFYLPRPKSAPKTRRVAPAVAPDLDKLLRSTDDALKTAAVWRDDSQVVDITARKRYATFSDEAYSHPWELPGPGAVITVIELGEDDTWADQPLDIHAAGRFPGAVLPAELAQYGIVADRADAERWGKPIVISRDVSDAKAKALADKAVKEVERRRALAANDKPVGDEFAVIVEDGRNRLASIPGKPFSALQTLLTQVARDGYCEDLLTYVLLADIID